MRLILNILWFIFGGFISGTLWLLAGVIMAVTIVGLPWTPAALRIAHYTLLPFGQRVDDSAAGPVSFFGNIVWFVLAGWWLALGHLVIAAALAITIIGLPFAWAHLKLAMLSLAPVGRTIVPA